MNGIVDHIEYLLRKQDCVIVPGWGAFIAQYSSASFDAERDLLLPPSRHYGFNGSLTFSDGLLENSIMRRNGCTYSAASDEVRNCVASFKQQVELGGELAIGRLGLFKKTDDGELLFQPFERKSVASDFYGLGRIEMSTLAKMKADEEPALCVTEDDEEDGHAVRVVPIGKKYLQIAASVIALLVMTFVLSTPLSVDRSSRSYAGMNDSFMLKDRDVIEDSGSVGELAVMLPESAKAAKQTIEKAAVAESQEKICASLANEGHYCLVVASGASNREARRFIKSQKNDEVTFRIYHADGKYRVYVATGRTYAELMPLQQKLQSKYPDAWICRK